MSKNTVKFPNQKQEPELSEGSPWLINLGRIAIARKIDGVPAVQWADGYVKLSDRVFWKHQIKVRDIVQIRSGWNENLLARFN